MMNSYSEEFIFYMTYMRKMSSCRPSVFRILFGSSACVHLLVIILSFAAVSLKTHQYVTVAKQKII